MFKKISLFLQNQLRLSNLGFLIFIPFSIAAAPFAFSFRENAPSIFKLILIGCLVTFPTALIYFTFVSILNRRTFISKTFDNLVVLVITGVIRGFIFFFLVEALGMQNPSPLLGRILNSTYTVAFWVGLASVLVESNRRFKRRYRALLTQILILKLRDSQSPEPGYALMAQQIARMQLNIKRTIQDKAPSRGELNHAEELANALRSEIESGLRPLSQRLWIKSVFAPPSTKVTGVVNAAISELKYPFLLTATLYGCANVINTTQSLGFSSGIIFGISTFIVFCLLERLRLIAISKFPNGGRYLNYFYVLFVGMAVGLVTNLVFKYLKLDYSFAVAIFSAPSLPILIIAVAGIRLSLSDRESMFDFLNRRISQSKLENLDSIIHGNAASYLHNSLQSELTALALQLDSLANNPDPERNRVVMEKLEALVSQSKSEDFKNFMETPEARLKRVVNSWDGIAEIDLNIDPLIWKDSSRSSIVVSLIQEAVANSVRSGRANRVDVVGEYSKDSIFVTVTDNGSAQVTTDRRGIGSQWIDRIAISDWKLEETDKGRVLRVEI